MTTPPVAVVREREDADLSELGRALVEVHARDGYPVEGVADPEAWLKLDRLVAARVGVADGHAVGHVALTEPSTGDAAARIWREQHPESNPLVLGRLFVAPLDAATASDAC